MHAGIRIASVASAGALLRLPLTHGRLRAESCASRSGVRTQVADLVQSLRDDVTSRPARVATAHALVETVHTFRGKDAETAAERRELGGQISALAKQLQEAPTRVERKALVLQIKALREQREPGGFTAEERAELRAALAALREALVGSTDSSAEASAVADAVRALQAQFTCTR